MSEASGTASVIKIEASDSAAFEVSIAREFMPAKTPTKNRQENALIAEYVLGTRSDLIKRRYELAGELSRNSPPAIKRGGREFIGQPMGSLVDAYVVSRQLRRVASQVGEAASSDFGFIHSQTGPWGQAGWSQQEGLLGSNADLTQSVRSKWLCLYRPLSRGL